MTPRWPRLPQWRAAAPVATTEGWWQLPAETSAEQTGPAPEQTGPAAEQTGPAAHSGPPGPAAIPGSSSPVPWQQRWFWLFFNEEGRQIALPVARRSAGAFGDLGDSIGQNPGIDPDSSLDVELGTGSVEPLTQIAFEVTVSSPYASTTVVVWTGRGPGAAGAGEQNVRLCMLSSTLLGPGRATTELDFGHLLVPPCTPDLWRPSPASAVKPDLTLAGIPTSGR